jgi:hypothetical protein
LPVQLWWLFWEVVATIALFAGQVECIFRVHHRYLLKYCDTVFGGEN